MGHQSNVSNTLIVTTSRLAYTFVRIYLMQEQNPSPIGFVVSDKSETQKKVATFLPLSDGVAVCYVDEGDYNANESNAIAKEIVDVCDKEARVVILASESLTSFRTDDPETRDQDSIARYLTTGSWNIAPHFQRLEQPNVIGGLPAALLTLCELVKKDSLLVVNFANYRDLDSLSLSGYCGLSKVLNKTTPFRPETTIAFRLKDLQQSRLPNILYT